MEITRLPASGESVTVDVHLVAAFGRLVKVEAVLVCHGELLARAALLLAAPSAP
jgi:hypothetical protein